MINTPRRRQAQPPTPKGERSVSRSSAAPDGYTRRGLPVPICPACNGYGYQDGRPATFEGVDHRRPGCRSCGSTGEAWDGPVRALTAFTSFQALLEAGGDYRPSIYTLERTGPATIEADTTNPDHRKLLILRALADCYDQAQANRDDDRRAYRGG